MATTEYVDQPSHKLTLARLEQDFHGHGLAVQPALQRGFRSAAQRPPAEAAASEVAAARRHPTMVVHVHLREKVMEVQCGEGSQRVFWLAVTATQRYLVDAASYSREYSAELTPKGVISAAFEYIAKTGRICDELSHGEHVWIDVG